MAITEPRAFDPKLDPILERVARALGRQGVKRGVAEGAPAILRVTLEESVERLVQVYWTPFLAAVPGRSIGLHLEVAEPRVHWCEAYLSPTYKSWVFAFGEREDSGEITLLHYRQCDTPEEGLNAFFEVAGWYTLTATDKSWSDVVFTVSDRLAWPEYYEVLSGEGTASAIQESLKKSTIMWLGYELDGETITRPVWYLYDSKADRLFVLSGERQQRLPGAERIRECLVTLRWKGKNASVADIPASVGAIDPADPEWIEIAEKIAEKRLNIPGLPEDTARRWREECVILELNLRL